MAPHQVALCALLVDLPGHQTVGQPAQIALADLAATPIHEVTTQHAAEIACRLRGDTTQLQGFAVLVGRKRFEVALFAEDLDRCDHRRTFGVAFRDSLLTRLPQIVCDEPPQLPAMDL